MIVKQRLIVPEWLEARAEVWRTLQWNAVRPAPAWTPPTDVYENEDGVVVQVEIAGMRPEDFAITLDERRLVVTGVRRDPEPKKTYYQMEINYGEFRIEVDLPWRGDPDCVEATYEAGFLRVFLPRPPACRIQPATRKPAER